MMCEYCDIRTNKDAEYMVTRRVVIKRPKDNGNGSDPLFGYALMFNYCPMCGRDLRGW